MCSLPDVLPFDRAETRAIPATTGTAGTARATSTSGEVHLPSEHRLREG